MIHSSSLNYTYRYVYASVCIEIKRERDKGGRMKDKIRALTPPKKTTGFNSLSVSVT